jgi:hypothetical protein
MSCLMHYIISHRVISTAIITIVHSKYNAWHYSTLCKWFYFSKKLSLVLWTTICASQYMLSPSVHNSTYCFLAVFPFLLFSVRKLRSQLLFQAIITKSTVFNNMNHNKQFHNQYIILLLHLPYYNMIKYFTFSIKIVALYMPGFSICRLLC